MIMVFDESLMNLYYIVNINFEMTVYRVFQPAEEAGQMPYIQLIKKIFSSNEIFLRLINCSFCWSV